MAYVEGFANDVFVSYAHADNESLLSDPWVSRFVALLETSLKQRLGCGKELKLFFDRGNLKSNDELEYLLDEVRRSAVFLSICSPSYVRRKWTIRELSTFADHASPDRLFSIEILPVPSDEYPPSLARKVKERFWHSGTIENRTPITIDPLDDRLLYSQKLLTLADQIKDALLSLRSTQPDSTPDKSRSQDPRGTVLLAQTTDDLELEREQVKGFLLQNGFSIAPSLDYPQGGDAFKEAFTRDLEQADLFVQLVGATSGRKPPDLPEGYLVAQYKLARLSGIDMHIWAHPEIDRSRITDSEHASILDSADTQLTGLERFKSGLLDYLEQRERSASAVEKPKTNSLVYLGADRSDLSVVQEVEAYLTGHKVPVVTPTFDGSAEEIRQDLEENLLDSDTLIFVHGSAPTTWIRGNLRRLHRLMAERSTPPRSVVVLKAPPPNKGDVGISLPYVKWIDVSEDMDIEPLLAEIENE